MPSSRASTHSPEGPGYGRGRWRGGGQLPTSGHPFTRTESAGRMGLLGLLFSCSLCPSVSPSLCSGTLTSMGMATSLRKSSRSSVGTSLTSAPLGTSTRTSEEGWGPGRGKASSLPLGVQFPSVHDQPLDQMLLAEKSTPVGRNSPLGSQGS